MTTSWILVANSSEAHLYASPRAKLYNGYSDLNSINDFINPRSRVKEEDLVTDKLGHNGHGTFVESSEPKQYEQECFAAKIAKKLEEGRVKHKFEDLILVASPKFDGKLKKCFNSSLQHMISLDIKKDYTKLSMKQLMSCLQGYI